MDAFYSAFNRYDRGRVYSDFLRARALFEDLNPSLEDEEIEAYVTRLIHYGQFISRLFEMSPHFFDLILSRIPPNMARYFGYNGNPEAFRTSLIQLMRNPETMIAMTDQDLYDILDLIYVIDEAMLDFGRRYTEDLEKTTGSIPRGGRRKCKKCNGYI